MTEETTPSTTAAATSQPTETDAGKVAEPLATEGTDVAAPASASLMPNDSPAQTGTSMGVSL